MINTFSNIIEPSTNIFIEYLDLDEGFTYKNYVNYIIHFTKNNEFKYLYFIHNIQHLKNILSLYSKNEKIIIYPLDIEDCSIVNYICDQYGYFTNRNIKELYQNIIEFNQLKNFFKCNDNPKINIFPTDNLLIKSDTEAHQINFDSTISASNDYEYDKTNFSSFDIKWEEQEIYNIFLNDKTKEIQVFKKKEAELIQIIFKELLFITETEMGL
jgi:hypothetical protein